MNSTTGAPSPEATNSIEIVGDVRRVVILTVRREPAACYLARRLRDRGVEIFLISQRRLKVEPDSPAYFRRLLEGRGVAVAADAVMLWAVRSAARSAVAVVRRLRGVAGGGNRSKTAETRTIFGTDVPVLREDPDIESEDWLTYLEVDNINSGEDLKRLQEIEPDLILLAGAPILGRKAIEMARIACLNPHCGITPEYCGSSPIDHAIREGRFDHIGYTVHVVVPKVDAGPVVYQERVDWDIRRSIRHLWPILAQKMYDKLAEITLELVAGKKITAVPQSNIRVNPPAGLAVRTLAELRRMSRARQSR